MRAGLFPLEAIVARWKETVIKLAESVAFSLNSLLAAASLPA